MIDHYTGFVVNMMIVDIPTRLNCVYFILDLGIKTWRSVIMVKVNHSHLSSVIEFYLAFFCFTANLFLEMTLTERESRQHVTANVKTWYKKNCGIVFVFENK